MKKNNAAIDILLPYWGEFVLFKQTVDSVVSQTNTNWRLFILDDCYPSDEAERYVATLGDDRITYKRHKKNIGITNNFNACIEQASADYCVIIGCDDVLLPNYVQTALENIGSADMYQPQVQVIDANGVPYLPLADKVKRLLRPKRSGVYKGERLAASLCTGNWLYFPSIVWKTATLKNYRFDTQYKIAEDVIVELDIIINGGTLFVDNATTFQYRRFAGSLSSKEKAKNGVRFNEEAAVYTMFARKFSNIGWHKAAMAAKIHLTSRLHHRISNHH